ncbi:CBS domain-containing protein [Infirmifilum lucidum]|uniref:CBS domain-containing protein n=1 Tax=Infirmifilum lucidum TaxID=2776706 RepID=A0A7L9FHI5_9CREN|nr:CBS domain-containing protein [Infirmifilum lucidum]QOJ78235.1 CBS domain-containing protein [Infirmifilum lucidum]
MKVLELGVGRYPPALYLGIRARVLDVLLGMASRRVRHCPLVDDAGRLVSMVSARDLMDFLGGRRFNDIVVKGYGGDVYRALKEVDASALSYKPPFVYVDSDLREVVETMFYRGVGALAVVDRENKLVGLISERHMMLLFADAETHVKVKEIMTRNLVSLAPSDTVRRGLQLMSERRVRRIPLVAGGALHGIVTVKDIIGFLASEDSLKMMQAGHVEAVYETPLAYIASRPVVTVDPEDDVGRAIRHMKDRGIGAVMVSSGGKPVGILTERDVMTRLPQVKGVETFIDELRQKIYASRVSF